MTCVGDRLLGEGGGGGGGGGGVGGEILYIEAGDRVLVYGVIYICTHTGAGARNTQTA